jgi:hypothetical protein
VVLQVGTNQVNAGSSQQQRKHLSQDGVKGSAAPLRYADQTAHDWDSGVGKTCLLLRYANNSFSPTFITTIGIDFKIKNVDIDTTPQTAHLGYGGAKALSYHYDFHLGGARGICCFVTGRNSFESIYNWIFRFSNMRIRQKILVEARVIYG